MIHRVFFQVTLPALTASGGDVAWVKSLGHQLINNVNLEIGGQEIDKHYSDWLEIWSQLTVPAGQRNGYNKMIGNTPDLTGDGLTTTPTKTLYIPLQFWFNRNPESKLGFKAACHQNGKTHTQLVRALRLLQSTASLENPKQLNIVPSHVRNEMVASRQARGDNQCLMGNQRASSLPTYWLVGSCGLTDCIGIA